MNEQGRENAIHTILGHITDLHDAGMTVEQVAEHGLVYARLVAYEYLTGQSVNSAQPTVAPATQERIAAILLKDAALKYMEMLPAPKTTLVEDKQPTLAAEKTVQPNRRGR